jgi:single-strand DNA-binding protein
MVNKVILIGNIGSEPVARTFSNNNRHMSFSLATNERWKSKTGEKQEKTSWHKISIFNENLIKLIENYAGQGSKIYIEGKLSTRKYTSDSGDKYVTEVVLEKYNGEIKLLGATNSGTGLATLPDKPVTSDYPLDDDIPF